MKKKKKKKKRYSNCTESPSGEDAGMGLVFSAASLWKSAHFHKKGAN